MLSGIKYSFAVAAALLSAQAYAAEILVIESYHQGFEWDKGYARAIKDSLGKKHKVSFFEMDTKRLPKDQYQARADAAWKKYQETKPDYVVLGDDNALKYLGPKFENEKTPVVFLGINRNPRSYFKNRKVPNHFTGLLERPLMKRSIIEISKFMPKFKKVLILFDKSTTSNASIDQEIKKLKKIGDINFDIKQVGKLETWQEVIKNAKRDSYDAVFVGLYFTLRDAAGKHVNAKELLNWSHANAKVPLFAFWSHAAGKNKTAGGLLIDGYRHGAEAANVLQKVVKGENPIVLVGKKGKFTFSKSAMARWNIVLPEKMMHKATIIE